MSFRDKISDWSNRAAVASVLPSVTYRTGNVEVTVTHHYASSYSSRPRDHKSRRLARRSARRGEDFYTIAWATYHPADNEHPKTWFVGGGSKNFKASEIDRLGLRAAIGKTLLDAADREMREDAVYTQPFIRNGVVEFHMRLHPAAVLYQSTYRGRSGGDDLTPFMDPRGPRSLPPAQADRMKRKGLIVSERGRWVLTQKGLEELGDRLKR